LPAIKQALWDLFEFEADEKSENPKYRKIKIWHILHVLNTKEVI
jgi:hypothetical protein